MCFSLRIFDDSDSGVNCNSVIASSDLYRDPHPEVGKTLGGAMIHPGY